MIHYVESRIRNIASGRHEDITAIIAVTEATRLHRVHHRRLQVARLELLGDIAAQVRVVVLIALDVGLLVGAT